MDTIRAFIAGDCMTIGKTGVRIDPTVTLGSLMNAIPLIAMLIGGLIWFLGYAGKTDDTRQKVAELSTQMDKQFAEQRHISDDNFKSVREAIANLPSQAAQLQQLISDNRDAKMRLDAQTSKLADTDRVAYDAKQAAIRLESRVDRLEQQVNAPVALRQTR